jgi:MFS family permease
MAASTAAIGVLPTFDVAPYRAGIAAPVLLALLRLLQGLAMGGEFGSAVIYVSELAAPSKRGKLVALLQTSVNAGMVLATLLAMLLQRTLSEGAGAGGFVCATGLGARASTARTYQRAAGPAKQTPCHATTPALQTHTQTQI